MQTFTQIQYIIYIKVYIQNMGSEGVRLLKNYSGYVAKIESAVCEVFDCSRFGFGGLVNTDFIEKCPYTTIVMTVAKYYERLSYTEMNVVSEFFDKYYNFKQSSISDINEDVLIELVADFDYLSKYLLQSKLVLR